MKGPGYVCPPCRLAASEAAYGDEHGRCHGTFAVRRAGAPEGEVPIERLHCACGDRGHCPAPRLSARAAG